MPGVDLYPRTVLARIFSLPMICSVPLLLQDTSGCQSNTRKRGQFSLKRISSPRS